MADFSPQIKLIIDKILLKMVILCFVLIFFVKKKSLLVTVGFF